MHAYGSGDGSINGTPAYMVPSVHMVSSEAQPRRGTHESNTSWLCIEYVNAHGLCMAKLRAAIGHLSQNMILFVSETWHIQDAKMRTCEGVMAISPELHRTPVSRGKGGLALFAHESVASRLHIVSTGEHHLSAKIDGISVSGIYLPPSMECATVKATLDALPESTDMILGDLNVRLGRHTRSIEQERCDAISGWCSRKGLRTRGSRKRRSRSSLIDHVLARASTHSKEYHVVKAPFETDHPLLSIQVRTNGRNTAKHTARFNIHRLKSADVAKRLCNAVETRATKACDKLVETSQSHQARDARQTIESLDGDLVCMVQKALTETVGTRRPAGLYTRGGAAKPKSTDTATAIMAIRAAQRESKAKCELVSLDETLTPHEEAVKHYTAIYRRTVERPRERWHSTNPTSPELETAQTVADAIKAYPSGKSPGVDGIDRRVMWMLTNAPVYMRLLKSLYNMCLRTGLTPRRWNQSVIAPIPKAGKDPKYISNRRPVALTVLFRRIFEKLILQQIVNSVKLNRGQASFRHGFSCSTQILLARTGQT